MASLPKTVQLTCAGLLIATALGARPASAQPLATTVQLPTFSSFSVSTSVSVPDSGGPYQDLVRRSRSGQTRPFSPLNPLLVSPERPAWESANESTAIPDDSNSISRKLSDVRRQRQRETTEREQAVRQLIARGREAAAKGRMGSARISFESAARKATGLLREEALAELKGVASQSKPGADRVGKATR